jgi:hypothetical protein
MGIPIGYVNFWARAHRDSKWTFTDLGPPQNLSSNNVEFDEFLAIWCRDESSSRRFVKKVWCCAIVVYEKSLNYRHPRRLAADFDFDTLSPG